jgi:hypothetical protein
MEMKRICCITTTYERPDMLGILTSTLERAVRNHKDCTVDHFILHDGPAKCLKFKGNARYHIEVAAQEKHLGRDKYHLTLTNAMHLAKGGKYDWYLHLNDDSELCREFFNFIEWDKKINGITPAFVLVHDERDLRHYQGSCYQQVDGLLLMPFDYLKRMDFTCPAGQVTESSSGAWRAFSELLLRTVPGIKMVHPNMSLVKHLCITKASSIMNPRDRNRVSLESLKFVDYTEGSFKWLCPWKGFHPILERTYTPKAVTVCENLGNAIQALPAYLMFARLNPHTRVDVLGPESAVELYRRVTGYFGAECRKVDTIDKTSTVLHRRYSTCKNEVDCYIDIARSHTQIHTPTGEIEQLMPFVPNDDMWGHRILPSYDIVISNGSLGGDATWLRKRYHRWHEVVKTLKGMGLSVGQVGWPDEYVLGCEDRTGLSPADSFDIIGNAKMFIGNDTGFYHFAAAIGKPGAMWCGPTACEKIWHPVFHRTITKVAQPCANGACYDNQGTRTKRWDNCQSWSCTFTEPSYLVEAILNKWKESNWKP